MAEQIDRYDDEQFDDEHKVDERVNDDQWGGQLASLLPQLSQRLQSSLHSIEPDFEVLGNTLHIVYGDSEKLTKGIKSSVDHINVDSEESLLHDVGNIVENSLSALSHCRESISGSLDNIAVCSDDLNRLSEICKKMKKNSDFLHILGLNIRVESNRTKVSTAMFEGFGGEIKALAAKLGETTSSIHSNAQKVQANQAAMQSRISKSMNSFDKLSASTEQAVAHANDEIHNIGSQAALTLEKAGDHSQKISCLVGEIVMAIQFHDIARQQVEHIISGMEDTLSILQAGVRENDNIWENDEHRRGGAYSILSIQAAQLKQVNSEAHRVYDNIETAFGQIREKVAQLIDDVAGPASKGSSGIDIERRFRSFQSKVETLYQLLVDGDELEAVIKKSMQDASSAVSTLFQFTDAISDINVDLQYKALNAMIMTNKLGREGSAFSVLSRNVRDVSTDSNVRVQEVVKIVQSITDASNEVSAILDSPSAVSLTEEGQNLEHNQEQNGLGMAVGNCIKNISGAFDEYKDNCAKTESLARDMVKALGETKLHLDFFPRWIDDCEQVFEAVESLLDGLSPWKELARNLPSDAQDDIARRYTMESERRVHQSLTRQDDIFDETVLAADGDDGGGEDPDDNIELF